MSTNPARFAGVGCEKGRIAPGYDADLVVWDPDRAFTLLAECDRSTANSGEVGERSERGYVSCFPNADADGISGRTERLYGGPRAHRPRVSARRRVPRRLDFLVCTITCNTEGANRSEPKRCEPKRASQEITLIDSRQCR
jgi:hypothetical protein